MGKWENSHFTECLQLTYICPCVKIDLLGSRRVAYYSVYKEKYMLIAIFGESCTGKSTLATLLAEKGNAKIFTGKDYLRLAKNEAVAKKLFQDQLLDALTGDNLIYVISQKEHLSLLPEGCTRILVTAELDTIKERFAARMHGTLPAPVAAMLERSHGCFDQEPWDFHIHSGVTDPEEVCKQIRMGR